MLPPDQEIHPAYLRTLRQTLNDIVRPEIASPAGRNALMLCDLVLVRMIAALEDGPHLRAGQIASYNALCAEAASLLDDAPPAGAEPIWTMAATLQQQTRHFFERLDHAPAGERRCIEILLAKIAAADASFREACEAAVKRIAARPETPLRALQITPDAIQTYLHKRFPGRDLRLRESRQIPGGRSKLTVMLAIEPDAVLPTEMVLRFDNPGSAQNTAVRDEFPVMQAMYESNVCAPEPLWLENDAALLGAPFLAMRRMAGAPPGTFWSAEGVSPALGLALAEALASIHRQSANAVWSAAPAAARDAVADMISGSEVQWRASGDIASVTMACAYNWLRRRISCIDGPTVPVHGDVHFANVLAEGDKLICLTDWEFVHPGHPAEDLAFCRRYIEQIMPWREFLAHYDAKGGAPITEGQFRFFAVWGQLRNIAFGAGVLGSIASGVVPDIQNLSIALHSRAKLEATLSKTIASEMNREAERL